MIGNFNFRYTDASMSPLSAHDRYSSPVPSSVRRQLFSTGSALSPSSSSSSKYVPIAPKPASITMKQSSTLSPTANSKFVSIASSKPPVVTVTPLEGSQPSNTELLLSPARKDGYVTQPAVQVSPPSPAKSLLTAETVGSSKPRRGGSLELFYRKVKLFLFYFVMNYLVCYCRYFKWLT